MASARETSLHDVRKLAARRCYDEALAGYREICARDPYDPDLWLELATVAESAGRDTDAMEALEHVLDLYEGTGMGEAVDVALRVLELAPGHVQARRIAAAFSRGHRPDDNGDSGDDDGAVPAPVWDLDLVPASVSQPVAVPLVPAVPMPAPASDSLATPRPRAPTLSVPVQRLPFAESASARPTAMLARMLESVRASPLLDVLDEEALSFLAEVGEVHHLRRGESVVREGERGDSLYLVLDGSVDVERYHPVLGTVVRLSTLSAGAFFGEQALVAGVTRSATVRARRRSVLLELDRLAIRFLSRRSDQVLVTLMRFFRARMVGTLMATSPLFHPFSAEERRAMVSRLRLRELPAQEVVVREGERAGGLYLVLIGTLVAFVGDETGGARKLGVLGAGDVFGEMSLIRDEPAMASVGTHTPSWILRLPREDFAQMVAAHPEVLDRLADIAAIRQAKNRGVLEAAAPGLVGREPSGPLRRRGLSRDDGED
ncbi:cyclic nucleotide-binding domain-containing protein [Haliangium ochraceum]|uniref:Putative transcriptional regulator, Crp/Fnr family n=1 Tax=Haliangium ochraceum (strain DSM 14365 / JCM 11303 / SMP-2) TaxID=502025 RepID=D0LSF5_HALO1|nr:cyclic nucleotide-binding domain-containing protein [Haliangium ochraceum]ACY15654.1 putative transcriptional regulator, Crp/Fnr family [Haliangium ochraceum DSM 14365]